MKLQMALVLSGLRGEAYESDSDAVLYEHHIVQKGRQRGTLP